MQQIINDVRYIKLIQFQKSDSAKSIFLNLEKLATDRVTTFRKKIYCCIKGVYRRILRSRSSF